MTSEILKRIRSSPPPPQWQLVLTRVVIVLVAVLVATYANAKVFDTEVFVVIAAALSSSSSEWLTSLWGMSPEDGTPE